MKNSDEMLEAIQQILNKARSYSNEPLVNKMKSKMVVAVEKPEEHEDDDVEMEESMESDDESDEDKEKLKAMLAKLMG